MESDLVRAVEIGASAVAEDFSLWSLFLQADIIVKAVIVVLLIASLWSWAIIFDKSLRYGRARRLAVEFEQAFWSGGSLDQLYDDVAAKRSHTDDRAVLVRDGGVAPLREPRHPPLAGPGGGPPAPHRLCHGRRAQPRAGSARALPRLPRDRGRDRRRSWASSAPSGAS